VVQTLIELRNVSKSFPGVKALQGVHFTLFPGEIVSLCGANGAGKSTMSNIIAGVYSHDSGEIIIDNEIVKFTSPKVAESLGIGIVHQEPTLVPRMSIVENIFLGKEITKNSLLDFAAMKKQAEETLASLGFTLDVDKKISTLELVEREAVEIAKAVMLKPRILILDEVTAPLNKVEVDLLFKLILDLKKQGIGIIFISHKLKECIEISDRIVVFRDGQNAAELTVTTDLMEKHIIVPMLGKNIDRDIEKVAEDNVEIEKREVLMQVKDFTKESNFTDINFTLHKGEIIGLAGLKGAGITEILMALQGAIPYDGGEVVVRGVKTKFKTPRDGISAGIGMVTNDRQKDGLALTLDVKSNMAIGSLKKLLTKFFFIDKVKLNNSAMEYVNKLNVKTPTLTQIVQNLSGGNQQKIVIAKWLLRNLGILLIDEPTRGVDVQTKSDIYKLLLQQKDEGKGILIFSLENRELLNICDRILIVVRGRIVDEIKRTSPKFNEPVILEIIHNTAV